MITENRLGIPKTLLFEKSSGGGSSGSTNSNDHVTHSTIITLYDDFMKILKEDDDTGSLGTDAGKEDAANRIINNAVDQHESVIKGGK